MTVIGLISDTHGLLRPQIRQVFSGVDLILHAGDVGGAAVLSAIAPTLAVYGNVDDRHDPALTAERSLTIAKMISLVIHWHGGRHTEVRVPGPTSGRTTRCTDAEAIALVRRMAGHWRDEATAAQLNLLGWRTVTGNHLTRMRVRELRSRLDQPACDPTQRAWLTATTAAQRLGLSQSYAGMLLKRAASSPARKPSLAASGGSIPWGSTRRSCVTSYAL